MKRKKIQIESHPEKIFGDLTESEKAYKIIKVLSGIDGIGRHARFRFLWGSPCGFDSHIPHWIFCTFVKVMVTVYRSRNNPNTIKTTNT